MFFRIAKSLQFRWLKKAKELRIWYYKKIFQVQTVNIYSPVHIYEYKNIVLHENVTINSFVHIWANCKLEIGKDTMIASHVQITTSTHDYNQHPMFKTRIDRPISIGSNVWIGTGAIILPGVTIGDNVVIGAGSLVNRDIPENSIAYGVPAKVQKKIPSSTVETPLKL